MYRALICHFSFGFLINYDSFFFSFSGNLAKKLKNLYYTNNLQIFVFFLSLKKPQYYQKFYTVEKRRQWPFGGYVFVFREDGHNKNQTNLGRN
jgi:hypothetical protein